MTWLRSPAVLFDLDGVISDTVTLHAEAWKSAFDALLRRHDMANALFSSNEDYFHHFDGKTRLSGIKSFLRSRKINLPLGESSDVGVETIQGVGNTKNIVFRRLLERRGPIIFADAIRLLDKLATADVEIGLVSSSKNARIVLDKSGLTDRFSTIMDGIVAEQRGIESKPDPAFYRFAAKLMNRRPDDCVAIEDATSGVMSAKQAGMRVVGMDRSGRGNELQTLGVDAIVRSLDELSVKYLLGRNDLRQRTTP